MTGFTATDVQRDDGTIILEIKSVNSRYLDLQFKLDETFKNTEFRLRELIKSKVNRGKVECKLRWVSNTQLSDSAVINESVIAQLTVLQDTVKDTFPESAELTVNEILKWPDVLKAPVLNIEAIQSAALDQVLQSLDALNSTRAAEGEKLKQIILDRLSEVKKTIDTVRPQITQAVQAYRDRLTLKLQEAMQSVDDDRVVQEMVLFAQRIDVDEELSRLDAHISEVKNILDNTGPVGKRLDFMMQEMNREANTLGSKSLSLETTNAAMSLKVLIEQMREQIQNIE